ncbi:hypothetical protein BU16DRAFT_124847 [Lophium mytilinum]|uniref:Uncharacterized protein n=1 Tax=Lophium mytilinum TaxID=390894 RepID=A0A6A6QI46_9PEZI|nr:hypothetical protein BU16DRAFT_124847 [Lophium mytilinum]
MSQLPPSQFTGRGGMQPWSVRSNYQTYRSPFGPKYKTAWNFHGLTLGRMAQLYVHRPHTSPTPLSSTQDPFADTRAHASANLWKQRLHPRRLRRRRRLLRALLLRRGAQGAQGYPAEGAGAGKLLRQGDSARGQPVLDVFGAWMGACGDAGMGMCIIEIEGSTACTI